VRAQCFAIINAPGRWHPRVQGRTGPFRELNGKDWHLERGILGGAQPRKIDFFLPAVWNAQKQVTVQASGQFMQGVLGGHRVLLSKMS
jgi:hypothetical protein